MLLSCNVNKMEFRVENQIRC